VFEADGAEERDAPRRRSAHVLGLRGISEVPGDADAEVENRGLTPISFYGIP